MSTPAVLERLQDELLRTTADMAVDLGAADGPGKARTAARGR
ncbi:hypothetical protein [Pseudonocardia oroxyli]|nr:hypothetical protein [Pseudonocardia oroxyli]